MFLALLFVSESRAQEASSMVEALRVSDVVIGGRIIRLDTFTDSLKFHSYNVRAGIAHLKVNSIKYGKIADNIIKVYYLRESGSHFRHPSIELEKDYIAFLDFDSINNHYVLYQHNGIYPLNAHLDSLYSIIIKKISQSRALDDCQYLELLISGINDNILLIKQELVSISMTFDSLRERYCIDSSEAHKFFMAFKNTMVTPYIDFTLGYYDREIDSILKDSIQMELLRIENSKEEYRMIEESNILNYMSKISFIQHDDDFYTLHSQLLNHMWWGRHNEFVEIIENIVFSDD